VTTISNDSSEVGGKSLEFLRLIVPTLSRVGFLYNPRNASWVTLWQHFSALAAASGLEAVPALAPTFADIDAAFETLVASGVEAFYAGANQGVEASTRMATLASSHQLASIGDQNYAAAGGLMGYGPDQIAMYRRAGYYVDRILKGAHPADLPVEFPTTFVLIVNQATAKALGVTIPDEVAQQVTSWI